MTTTTQHISPDPARRLADKIRARTNNCKDLIDLLHDISKGAYNANKNDRVTAANYLFNRGYGKCPKQPPTPSTEPVLSPVEGSERDPESAESDNHTNHSSDTPQTAAPHSGPDSHRLVTQVEDALNDSLGPAPSAHTGVEAGLVPALPSDSPQTPDPFDPFSFQSSIQAYIIEITNDGDTLIDTLIEIAYAADDDSTVTSHHRTRAGKILTDRGMGADPNALRSAVCPECRRKWTNHPGSHDHSEPSDVVGDTEEEPFDKEVWEGIIADLNQMEEAGIITPDPDAPEVDMSTYMNWTDEEIEPYAAEAAAKLRADIKLRLERQKKWPEIEERRRKKLAQTYPSHTDSKSPDT